MRRALCWSVGTRDSKWRASLQPSKVGCSYEEVEDFGSRGKHGVLLPRIQSSHAAVTVCEKRAQTKQQGWTGGQAIRMRRLPADREHRVIALAKKKKTGLCRKNKIYRQKGKPDKRKKMFCSFFLKITECLKPSPGLPWTAEPDSDL